MEINKIIDKIFGKKETNEDIKARGNFYFNIEEKKRLVTLNEEIKKFKKRFKGDIDDSPEMYALFKIFGHTDINKLNIKELMMLGFISQNTTISDIEDLE